MSSGLKIAGIVVLIAAVIAAKIWTREEDSIKTAGSAAAEASVKAASNDKTTGSYKKTNSIFKSHLIMPGVWEITDGTAQSPAFVDIYLVEGKEKALVIDAGVSRSDLAGYIRTLTDKPLELVLTHGHSDHVASVNQFDEVYMSTRDFYLISYMANRNDFKASGFKDIKDGEVFDLGGCRLEVLALPGHTPGSVVLLDRERQILFAGDAIGSGSLWLQLPESSSVEEFRDAIRKFEKSLEGLTDLKVWLGHSCLMGQKPDRKYVTDTRIAAEKIVSGEITGTPSGNSSFPGSVSVSYGQMTEFLYRPDKVFKVDK